MTNEQRNQEIIFLVKLLPCVSGQHKSNSVRRLCIYYAVLICCHLCLLQLLHSTENSAASLSIVHTRLHGRFLLFFFARVCDEEVHLLLRQNASSNLTLLRSHRQTKCSRNSRKFHRWAAVVDVCMTTETTRLIRFQSAHFIFRYPPPLIIFPVRLYFLDLYLLFFRDGRLYNLV